MSEVQGQTGSDRLTVKVKRLTRFGREASASFQNVASATSVPGASILAELGGASPRSQRTV